jgi:hypothetical protein
VGSVSGTPFRTSGLRRLLAWPPLAPALVAAGLLACAVFWLATTPAAMERLAGEGGALESITAMLYSTAIAALLASARRAPWLFVGSAFAVALLLARELDLHRLTSESALATNSYGPDGMPIGEQLVAGSVVAVLAALALAYVAAAAPRFLRALRAGRPHAATVASVLVLLAYSATIDGLQRKARDFLGLSLPQAETAHLLGAFEEGMEVLIPLLILLALAQTLCHDKGFSSPSS